MRDGIYSLTFPEKREQRISLLIMQKGQITGAAADGIQYDGEYIEGLNTIALQLKIRVPQGATLLQGTLHRSNKYEIPVRANISRTAFESGIPVPLELPRGPVNATFKLLRTLAN